MKPVAIQGVRRGLFLSTPPMPPHSYCDLCQKLVRDKCRLDQPAKLSYKGCPIYACANMPEYKLATVNVEGHCESLALAPLQFAKIEMEFPTKYEATYLGKILGWYDGSYSGSLEKASFEVLNSCDPRSC